MGKAGRAIPQSPYHPQLYGHYLSRRALLMGATATALSGCRPASDPLALKVGATATGVPFTFVDPKTNELAGALIDIVTLVAHLAGMPISLEIVPFAALIPSLTAQKIDVISAAMLRTQQRAQIVAFTDPVYAYGGGLVISAKETGSPATLLDLRGYRVGAQVGTAFVGYLSDAGIDQIVTYDNLSDALRDLSHGRIEAAYGDAPILRYQLQVFARPGLRFVTSFKDRSVQEVCFILRKDDPRIEPLNKAIAIAKAGQLDQILNHWHLVEVV